MNKKKPRDFTLRLCPTLIEDEGGRQAPTPAPEQPRGDLNRGGLRPGVFFDELAAVELCIARWSALLENPFA